MANQMYPKGREKFLGGDLDWDAHNFIVLLVKTAETFNASHEFIADLSGANIVARSGNVANKTKTDGVANCDPVVIAAVPSGSSVNAVLARTTGNDSTSPLVAFYDTGTNFPGVTNGADVTFQPDPGVLHLFKL